MFRLIYKLGIAAAAAAACTALPAGAQSLAARVQSAGDGRVQMRFASRPGVCGDGRDLIGTGPSSYMRLGGSYTSDDTDWRMRCVAGPVRVVLGTSGGAVQDVRVSVGGTDSASDVHDLGVVPAGEAASYLLAISRQAGHRDAETCITAAVLADSATVWHTLLDMARDSTIARPTRDNATFWLSRFAAAAVNHTELFDDNDVRETDDEDVRGQAIFALSQQPRHEGVEPLIRIARTNRDAALRSKAMFWLGQSHDPRALALFADVLGRGD